MVFKLPTMTRETSSSTSTGDMVLAGAQTGYYAVNTATTGLANGDQTWVTFKMGSDEETGRYTYNSGANSFTRTRILRSTNGGSAVSWAAGTKDVIVGLPGFSDLDATELALLLGLLFIVPLKTTDTTDASSSITGSGIFAGGVGVAKKLNVGDATDSTSTSTGSGIFAGGLAVVKSIFAGGKVTAADTTDASSSITGSGIFAGGVGVAKNLYVGAKAFLSGISTFYLGTEVFGIQGSAIFRQTGDRGIISWIFANSAVSTGNHIEFISGSGATSVGIISSNGTNTTYGTSSDARLKKDRRPFSPEEARAAINALTVYDHGWAHSERRSIGVYAQEACGHIKDMIAASDDGGVPSGDPTFRAWQADYSKAVPYLITDAQEMHREIAALKQQITELVGHKRTQR